MFASGNGDGPPKLVGHSPEKRTNTRPTSPGRPRAAVTRAHGPNPQEGTSRALRRAPRANQITEAAPASPASDSGDKPTTGPNTSSEPSPNFPNPIPPPPTTLQLPQLRGAANVPHAQHPSRTTASARSAPRPTHDRVPRPAGVEPQTGANPPRSRRHSGPHPCRLLIAVPRTQTVFPAAVRCDSVHNARSGP